MCAQELILKEECRDDLFAVSVQTNQEQDIEYAFYLFRNDEKIQVVWYQPGGDVEFRLKRSGVYHVAAFARKKGQTEILGLKTSERYAFVHESEIPNLETVCPVSIWGSCVSRDVLACHENTLQLKTYVARQSIVSALSVPIQCDQEIALSSGFQKRMVQYDLDKQGLSQFQEDGSRFLIVDMVDERFDLAKVHGSYVTMSNELKASGVLPHGAEIVKKEKRGSQFFVEQCALDTYVDRFAREITRIYKPDHIIIHVAKLQDYYVDERNRIKKFPVHHIWNNKRVNELLASMYRRLKEQIPEAAVIDVCDDYCADTKHKWGLAPMHYQTAYYEHVLKEIVDIIKRRM